MKLLPPFAFAARCRRWLPAVAAACLVALAAPQLARADEDLQAEIEKKKKEREEAEKARAAAEVKESDEQREARERIEKKENNTKLARQKFQMAAQAAAKRQNDKGLEFVEAAWYLDPTNMDYPLNAALFAKALNKTEQEFRALAAVKVLAKKNLSTMDPAAPKRAYFEEELANANLRMETLRSKISTGLLQVTVDPGICEIFIESAWAGIGTGEMEVQTGQRKIETRCIGYTDFEKFENVREGDPTKSKIKPTPIPYFGKLVIKVDQPDVTIFLDDVPTQQRLGEKPTKDGTITGDGSKEQPFTLAARKWIIRFQKEGYDRWHRRIDVRRDQTILVDAHMESLAEQVEGNDANRPDAKPSDKPAGKPGDKPADKGGDKGGAPPAKAPTPAPAPPK